MFRTDYTDSAWTKLSTVERVAIMDNTFGRTSAKAATYRAKWARFL